MSSKQRYWYRRVWTPAQKRRILAEVAQAKTLDQRNGTRGGVQAICDKYQITTAFIHLWRKQWTKAVETADQSWFTNEDRDAAE